jgi:hypothetical protein
MQLSAAGFTTLKAALSTPAAPAGADRLGQQQLPTVTDPPSSAPAAPESSAATPLKRKVRKCVYMFCC